MFFLCSRNLLRYYTTYEYHISLVCSCLCHFPRLFMVLMFLTVFRSSNQVFCILSLYMDKSHVFLVVIWELCPLGRKTIELKCHFITSRIHTVLTQLITVKLGNTWLLSGESDFSTVKLFFFFSLHNTFFTRYSWESTLTEWVIMLHLLRERIPTCY